SWGAPFLHVSPGEEQERAFDAVGQTVLLAVNSYCQWRLLAEDDLDAAAHGILGELREEGRRLDFPAKLHLGKISEDVAALTPDDARHFGGKASNFGFLLREIPDNTRPFAVAFSFDLWDAYMQQEAEPGVTLENWIQEKLA